MSLSKVAYHSGGKLIRTLREGQTGSPEMKSRNRTYLVYTLRLSLCVYPVEGQSKLLKKRKVENENQIQKTSHHTKLSFSFFLSRIM